MKMKFEKIITNFSTDCDSNSCLKSIPADIIFLTMKRDIFSCNNKFQLRIDFYSGLYTHDLNTFTYFFNKLCTVWKDRFEWELFTGTKFFLSLLTFQVPVDSLKIESLFSAWRNWNIVSIMSIVEIEGQINLLTITPKSNFSTNKNSIFSLGNFL